MYYFSGVICWGVGSINCYQVFAFSSILWQDNALRDKTLYSGILVDICLLTLKAPNQNCSRRHFNFLLLSFEENKAWFFMWILCLAEDSLETSSLIFSGKQWKNIYECRLLHGWHLRVKYRTYVCVNLTNREEIDQAASTLISWLNFRGAMGLQCIS